MENKMETLSFSSSGEERYKLSKRKMLGESNIKAAKLVALKHGEIDESTKKHEGIWKRPDRSAAERLIEDKDAARF